MEMAAEWERELRIAEQFVRLNDNDLMEMLEEEYLDGDELLGAPRWAMTSPSSSESDMDAGDGGGDADGAVAGAPDDVAGEEEEGEVHSEEEGDVDLFAADGVFEDDIAAFDDGLGGEVPADRRRRPRRQQLQPVQPPQVPNVNAGGADMAAQFDGAGAAVEQQGPAAVDQELAAAQARADMQAAELAADLEDGGGFALEEMLGLRGGTVLRLVKNVLFLVLFNLVYIAVVALVPSTIGHKTHKAVIIYGSRLHELVLVPVHNALDSFSPLILQCVSALYEWSQFSLIFSFFNNLRATSNVINDVIKIDDLVVISLGYFSVFVFVSVLGLIFSSMVPTTSITAHTAFRWVSNNILGLSKTAKVGSLLFLRILVLPLILGVSLISLVNNYLLFYSSDLMAHFVARNILGCSGLAWVIGITFMLVITLSILQLREVLHPDLLGRVIRPQETQVELMQSLIYDNGLVHTRRMVSSALVYLSIACLYVYVPLKLYYTHMTWSRGTEPSSEQPLVTIYSGMYYCTEIQLPLELTALHLCLLSALEKRKNIIGRLQHRLLLLITTKLDMARMLLPFRMRMRPRRGQAVSEGPVLDEEGQVVVKGPMKRPPKGWDSRKRSDVGRWSWTAGNKPPVELQVAPRLVAEYWLPKLVLVFVLQWLLVIFFIFTHTVLPVLTGRAVMGLLQVPQQYLHDPLNFVLGMTVLTQLFGMARYVVENDNFCSCVATLMRLPYASVMFIARLVVLFCVVSTVVGLAVHNLSATCAGCSAAIFDLRSAGMGLAWTDAMKPSFQKGIAGVFSSYGIMVTAVGAETTESLAVERCSTLVKTYFVHLLGTGFMRGAGLTTVVLWALCSGFVRQLLPALRLVPVLGNIGGPLQQLPDLHGITALFLRDLRAGSVERVMIHLQLMHNALIPPLTQYFESPWTYLNATTGTVLLLAGGYYMSVAPGDWVLGLAFLMSVTEVIKCIAILLDVLSHSRCVYVATSVDFYHCIPYGAHVLFCPAGAVSWSVSTAL
jgi:hypothetical protein